MDCGYAFITIYCNFDFFETIH